MTFPNYGNFHIKVINWEIPLSTYLMFHFGEGFRKTLTFPTSRKLSAIGSLEILISALSSCWEDSQWWVDNGSCCQPKIIMVTDRGGEQRKGTVPWLWQFPTWIGLGLTIYNGKSGSQDKVVSCRPSYYLRTQFFLLTALSKVLLKAFLHNELQ